MSTTYPDIIPDIA